MVAPVVAAAAPSIWGQLAVSFAATLASSMLMSMISSRGASTGQDAVSSKVQTPTTSEGTGVVEVFGTICLKSMNVTYSGGERTVPIVEKVKGGKGK